MAISSISARVDSKDKAAFDSFCSRVGMNASTAINIFIKTVIREQRIPFTIESGDPFYTDNNINFIKESIEQINTGRTITKTLDELEAMENA